MSTAPDLAARELGVSRRAEAVQAGRVHTARLMIRERRIARRLDKVRSEIEHLTR